MWNQVDQICEPNNSTIDPLAANEEFNESAKNRNEEFNIEVVIETEATQGIHISHMRTSQLTRK